MNLKSNQEKNLLVKQSCLLLFDFGINYLSFKKVEPLMKTKNQMLPLEGNHTPDREQTWMQELVHNAETTFGFQGVDQSDSCICEHLCISFLCLISFLKKLCFNISHVRNSKSVQVRCRNSYLKSINSSMPSIAQLPTGMAVGVGTSKPSLDFCGRGEEVKKPQQNQSSCFT